MHHITNELYNKMKKLQRIVLTGLFLLVCGASWADGTIASRTQINTCVPTVYIDILDGEKDANLDLISTKDASGNKVFKFKNNNGEYVDISDAIIEGESRNHCGCKQ